MIDRIRHDIQERLDQLLAEADRLRQALSALGSDRGQSSSRATARSTNSSAGTRSRSRSSTRSRPATRASSSRSRARGTSATRTRAASGGTKNAVLKALADANGQAMTASEVAAATGLGRASVSTTLSKLARAGDVNKADRGYRLSGGASASPSGDGSA
jgi:DNA-binding transcriptional ArsR family regulator